jgi:hypothetical protein
VQTARDQEIVRFIARFGAASAEHVRANFAMCQSRAYARLRVLVGDGLLDHRQLLHRTPGLYIATREGLRWGGLSQLSVQRLSPASFQHAAAATSAAVALSAALPRWQLLSERELAARERDGQALIASVRIDGPAVHRPDLALLGGEGQVLAIEVELSLKAARRLRSIARAYARARHIAHVYYLAAPPAARAVTRAAAEVRASDRITVLALDGADALAAAVRAAGGGVRRDGAL